jgi:signal transduction histidine kinase
VFLDLNTDQVQDAAARGDVQISHRFALLQRTNGEPLLLATMLAPVSHPVRREVWEKLRPGEEHDEQLWLRWQINAGMIFACLDYETIIRDIQGETPPEVEVRIYSADQPDLTALTLVAPPSVADLGKGGATYRASFERAHRWAMYGDRWSLVFRSTPAFDRNSTRYRAWWAGGLGLATTGLFCWALSLQIRARRLQARRAAELREARDALQAAQGERERLCHDLHDGAIQSLYAIQLGFTRIGREMEALSPAAGRQLAAGRASLDAVIGELREFITDNRREENRKPAGGLDQVLNSLTERLRPESAASIELDCDTRASARLTPAQAVQLSAIAREALSNSMRHARARIITVRLAAEGLFVILEVNDDGSGFNLAGGSSGGIGLNTMRRRAEGLGTILDLKSAPGRGTRIRVAVPVAAESEPENGDDE